MATRDEPLRSLVSPYATEGEARVISSTAAEDEGTAPNPSLGNVGPDDRREERSGLNLRTVSSIGTWNIRGLTTGKLEVITREMERLNIQILGITEHWMLGHGKFTTESGHTMIYSGKEEGHRRQGVGIILDKETAKTLKGFDPISSRILTIRLNAHPINISIIQVYAPTSDSTDEELESFYSWVQEAHDKVPSQDMLLILGDFNAKVGKMGIKSAHVGTCGLGNQNERGEKLVDFCASNDLVIGNTWFQHHPRRLYTWISPGGRDRNQIDYVLIQRRWRTSLLNVKTRPAADCGSDHQLLCSKLKIKLKAVKKKTTVTRYDVKRIPEAFTIDIKNKFTSLLQLQEDYTPEELWSEMSSSMNEIAQKHIPKKKKIKKPWLKNDTLNIAEQRRNAKSLGNLTLWSRLNKEFNIAAKVDKEEYLQEKCEDLERSKFDPRKVSNLVKEITGKWSPQSEVLNDKNGHTLTETNDILKRWAEYCEDLHREPQNHSWSPPTQAEIEPEPTREEVQMALKQLPNNKSPGIDNIPAEIWKASGDTGVTLLWKLCTKIWNTKEWPRDWCRGVFIPLPKKGNLKECANHRTINLIVHASKILLKIIVSRLQIKYQQEISDEQAGFVKEKGAKEQITNIKIIMQKCREDQLALYLCFIDYAKAFDCVNHTLLWTDMQKMGFPAHVIELLARLYQHQEATVRINSGTSEYFPIRRGVRQGCIVSPSLFNIYSEDIMRDATEDSNSGPKIGGRKVNNLRYADDTTLLCGNKEDLMNLLKTTQHVSRKKGLLLNVKKTKIMVIDNNRNDFSAFYLEGQQLEEVKDFVYLGSRINTKVSDMQEVKRRLAIARTTVQKMDNIWKSSAVKKYLKLRLLRSTAFAVASYGCESWTFSKKVQKKIDAFEMWAYRRILRVPWTERRTNEWILQKLNTDMMLKQQTISRKMQHFGHVIRHDSLEKTIIQGKMEGRRARGRPPRTWYNDIEQWIGKNIGEACRIAEDREAWRQTIKATAARLRAN
jgi:exonuclease III